jgi:hypothetical protein
MTHDFNPMIAGRSHCRAYVMWMNLRNFALEASISTAKTLASKERGKVFRLM